MTMLRLRISQAKINNKNKSSRRGLDASRNLIVKNETPNYIDCTDNHEGANKYLGKILKSPLNTGYDTRYKPRPGFCGDQGAASPNAGLRLPYICHASPLPP